MTDIFNHREYSASKVNLLTDKGIHDYVSNGPRGLTYLCLREDGAPSSELAIKLAHALAIKEAKIEVIEASMTGLTEAAMSAIIAACGASVHTINFDVAPFLGTAQWTGVSLVRHLALLPNLRSLSFSTPMFRFIPLALHLAQWIPTAAGLRSLSFELCSLGPALSVIAEAVAKSPTIEDVSITRDNIDFESGEMLAAVAIDHPTLKTLNLVGSHLAPATAKYLAEPSRTTGAKVVLYPALRNVWRHGAAHPVGQRHRNTIYHGNYTM